MATGTFVAPPATFSETDRAYRLGQLSDMALTAPKEER